jgi:hypothetical protein
LGQAGSKGRPALGRADVISLVISSKCPATSSLRVLFNSFNQCPQLLLGYQKEEMVNEEMVNAVLPAIARETTNIKRSPRSLDAWGCKLSDGLEMSSTATTCFLQRAGSDGGCWLESSASRRLIVELRAHRSQRLLSCGASSLEHCGTALAPGSRRRR